MSKEVGQREVVNVALTQGAMILGTVFALKLLTNLLSIEEYGLLSIALAIAAGFQIIYNSVSNAILRFLPIAQAEGNVASFRNGLKQLVIIALIAPCVSFIILLSGLNILDETLLPAYGIAILLSAAAGILAWYQTVFLGLRRREWVLGLTIVVYILRPLFAVFLIFVFGPQADVVILGYFLVLLVALPLAYRAANGALDKVDLPPSIGSRAEKSLKNYSQIILRYSIYFVVAGLFIAVILQIDRWLLKSFVSLEQLGIYAAILAIATVSVNMVFGFMSQLMTPVIFQRFGRMDEDTLEGHRAYRLYIAVSLVLYLGLTIGTGLLQRPIVGILTNAEFIVGAGLLPILVAAQAFEKLGQSITLLGFAKLVTWPYLWARIGQLLLLLIGGIWAVQTYGTVGIAYIQVVASAVFLVLTAATNFWVLRPSSVPT